MRNGLFVAKLFHLKSFYRRILVTISIKEMNTHSTLFKIAKQKVKKNLLLRTWYINTIS